ncbi:M48 family metallopeptidase [Marinomonas balearica]|uniref:Peptidase M48-like protein n=1 Tax=Marinomonas balearica TaxID=491947 RepID=A0A4R6M704_9GAMM|nr:M48 family metalloprotease [Marinomonas balearica]TDO96906.1 peptidase M48-like protein [Marinomonas balearica]
MQRITKTIITLFALPILVLGLATYSIAADKIPDLEAIKDERSLSNPSYVLGQYWFRKYNGSNALIDFPPAYEYLSNTVSQLSSYSNLNNKTVETSLLNSTQANAFVLPGNHLFIYSDILSLIKEEDELYALLAHEISHLELRHYERRLYNTEQEKKRLLLLLAAGVAAAIIGKDADTTSALWIGGIANQATNQLAYSRENEQEADRRGRQLLNNIGIPSGAMTKLFNEFLKNSLGGNKLEFLSTHPLPQTRLSDSITGESQTPLSTSILEKNNQKQYGFGFFRATLIAYRALLDDRPYRYIQNQQLSSDETLFAQAIVSYQSNSLLNTIETLNKIELSNRFTDYLLVLTHIKSNNISKAKRQLNNRLELAPNDPIFAPLLAQLEDNEYLPYSLNEPQFELRLKLKSNIDIAVTKEDNTSALIYKSLMEFNKGKADIAQGLITRAQKQGGDKATTDNLLTYYQNILEAEKASDITP